MVEGLGADKMGPERIKDVPPSPALELVGEEPDHREMRPDAFLGEEICEALYGIGRVGVGVVLSVQEEENLHGPARRGAGGGRGKTRKRQRRQSDDRTHHETSISAAWNM